MKCVICRERTAANFVCVPCGCAYDRGAFSDCSVDAAMIWAAARARRFERKRGQARLAARLEDAAVVERALVDKLARVEAERDEALAEARRLRETVRRVFAAARWQSHAPDVEWHPDEATALANAELTLADYLASVDADGLTDADADEVAVCALLTVWRVADDDEGGPPYLERDPDVAALLEEATHG